MAHVHVVIIGLDDGEGVPGVRRLFSYEDLKGDPHESPHAVLSPYLFDAGGGLADPHLVVREESRPINGMSQLILTGSQAHRRRAHLIFSSAHEAETFISPTSRVPRVHSCVRSSARANTCKVASD